MVTTSEHFDAIKGLNFRQVDLVVFGRNFKDLMDILLSAQVSQELLDGLKASMETIKDKSYVSSHRQIQEKEVAALILTVLDRIQVEEDDAS